MLYLDYVIFVLTVQYKKNTINMSLFVSLTKRLTLIKN